MNMNIEAMHGALEWVLLMLVVAAGFAVNRYVRFKKERYISYAVFLVAVFVLDLNSITFRFDALNFLLYLLVLLVVAEFIWVCRARGRLLLAGAFAVFVPIFLYVFVAAVAILPFPCHENGVRGGQIGKFSECSAGTYTLTRRLSFDIFAPARIYILSRDIRYTPFKKQVDRFSAPKGYMEADFSPNWECAKNGKGRAHLFIDGYTLWTLEEKKK